MPRPATLPQRLRQALGGKTPYAFAKLAGVDARLLRRYLTGEVTPPFERIALLAAAAGVSAEWLAEGRGEMRPPEIAEAEAETLRERHARADRVREAAEKVGGVAALGLKLLVAAHVVQRWVIAKDEPTPDDLTRIAKATDVFLNWLQSGTPPRDRPSGPGTLYDELRPEMLASYANEEDDLALMQMPDDSMRPTIEPLELLFIRLGGEGDGIYLCERDHRRFVRRLQFTEDAGLRLTADNPNVPPMEWGPGEGAILGRVVGVLKRS